MAKSKNEAEEIQNDENQSDANADAGKARKSETDLTAKDERIDGKANFFFSPGKNQKENPKGFITL